MVKSARPPRTSWEEQQRIDRFLNAAGTAVLVIALVIVGYLCVSSMVHEYGQNQRCYARGGLPASVAGERVCLGEYETLDTDVPSND